MRLADRLYQKGWTSEEIEHAMQRLSLAEQSKHPAVKLVDVSIYWVLLAAVVVTVIALTQLMFPFLSLLKLPVSLVIAAVLGSVFGMLFSFLLHDLDKLAAGHHVLVLIVAVVTTIGSSLLAIHFSIALGATFALLFCVNYIYHWWQR